MIELSKKFLDKDLDLFTLNDVIKLQDLIEYHSDLYHNKEEPVISDFQYDELLKKLEFLENKFEIDSKKSDTVWYELIESNFKKVKHSRPMISLDNTYNEEDLMDFDSRVFKNLDETENFNLEYILEFKFDGLWVELIYKDWNLIQAITRGNWIFWEDVTENIMQIDNIPKKIKYKDLLEVRWEVVMPISSFEELNDNAKKQWTKIFSNPRNAASGSIRMKDNRITKERKLKFFAYDLANFEEFRIKENIENYFNVIKSLENLGFEISSYFKKFSSIKEVIKAINSFWDLKNSLDFEIDWLVLKVNNLEFWKIIGWTEHHPKYAIAYKFPAEIFTTKIISVDHQVWRTGTITPVANLEPINMNWAIIKRATLHNYEEVENLWVRIWDNVFIKRAWEVIPKIISVVKQEGREKFESIKVPEFCPGCKTKILKDEWKVRYYCPNNIDCPLKNYEKLVFAVGKWWFDIDGLWEKQLELFLKDWIITNLVDVFKIKEKKDRILGLEWFKEKSVENLISWIEKAKKVDIATFLASLWISQVWKKTAKTLAKRFKDENDLINFSYGLEKLEDLDDVWPEIAKNIIEYFSLDDNKKFLFELIQVLDIKYYENKNLDSDLIFSWKKVCITWNFEYEWNKVSRDDLIKKLENSGWEFVSSVSKNTDFLLVWEKAGSKLEKAKKLNIEILSLEDFYDKIKIWF